MEQKEYEEKPPALSISLVWQQAVPLDYADIAHDSLVQFFKRLGLLGKVGIHRVGELPPVKRTGMGRMIAAQWRIDEHIKDAQRIGKQKGYSGRVDASTLCLALSRSTPAQEQLTIPFLVIAGDVAPHHNIPTYGGALQGQSGFVSVHQALNARAIEKREDLFRVLVAHYLGKCSGAILHEPAEKSEVFCRNAGCVMRQPEPLANMQARISRHKRVSTELCNRCKQTAWEHMAQVIKRHATAPVAESAAS